MLNFASRSIRSLVHPTLFQSSLHQRLQFASFTIKDILYDSPNDAGTLITRFAKHIAVESYKFDPLIPTTIRYSDFFPVHDTRIFYNQIQKISADQLPALIIFSFTYRSNGDPAKFARVLNDIDNVCLDRLPEMNNDTLFRTLYSLLFLIPNKITRMDFFKGALKRLIKDFDSQFPKEKFVQACFYLGLLKKNSAYLRVDPFKEFLGKYLDIYTEQLSTLDIAIVTSSIYKTSTRVASEAYLKRLQQEILCSPLDHALLITLVKNLRLQRVKSDEICKRLEEICNSAVISEMSATGLAHIFAYFAENRWDDHKITKPFIEEFMSRLRETKKLQSEHIRAKDLGTFLWCCSQLNCKFSETELKYLETVVLDKVEHGEFQNFPDQLVDCSLSLWMIGLKSRTLLQNTISLKNDNYNARQRDHSTIDNRFTVLQSAAAIEYPVWVPSIKGFEEDCPAPADLLKNHQNLTTYFKKLTNEKDIASAVLVCPIKGINIPGILVKFEAGNQTVFVELMEEGQMLRFSQEPIAILKLKQNLLTALGFQVVNLRPQDIAEQYTCLKDLIQKDVDHITNSDRQHLVNNM